MEQTLLALTAPHREIEFDRKLQQERHWARDHGTEKFYVLGPRANDAYDKANRMLDSAMSRLSERGIFSPGRILSFTFDSMDPLRCSASNMLASIMIQIMSSRGYNDDPCEFFKGLFAAHAGWWGESFLSMCEFFLSHFHNDTILVLHNFDECSPRSRTLFLKFLKSLEDRMDFSFKIIITTRKPRALMSELQYSSKTIEADFDNSSTDGFRLMVDETTRRCPVHADRESIRKRLDILHESAPDPAGLSSILRLIQHYTGWPKTSSKLSLSNFSLTLALVQPTDTPELVLDRILKSGADIETTCWGLGWLLCGYRPLSLEEFVAIWIHHRLGRSGTIPSSSSAEVSVSFFEELQQQMEPSLRLLVELHNDQISLHREVQDLFEPNPGPQEYLWNQVRSTAHRTLFEFCVTHIISPNTVDKLQRLYQQYQLYNDAQQKLQNITSPITPDGRDITFYAVQALPFHLSHLDDPAAAVQRFCAECAGGPSTIWAKMYWAMSNSFSRTPNPPESALPVLWGLGFVSPDDLKAETDRCRVQRIISAIYHNRGKHISTSLDTGSFTLSDYQDILTAAIQADDEDVGMKAVASITSHPQWDDSMTSQLRPATWAATWANMSKLVEVLLQAGVNANCKPELIFDGVSPFPWFLNIACRLGHSDIVKSLLAHEAKTDVKKEDSFSNFSMAAACGHISVLQALIEHDGSQTYKNEAADCLRHAAVWGSWNVVSMLLELRGRPDDDDDPGSTHSPPLVTACKEGYPRTVKELLKGGVDPNALGPYEKQPPLYYAAVKRPSVEAVCALLEAGGDPNHEEIQPSLMCSIAFADTFEEENVISVCDALLAGKERIHVDAQDSHGQTPLMWACYTGKLPLVCWLLDNGADINVVTNQKRDSLYYAIWGGHLPIIAELLGRDPGPNLAVALPDDGNEPTLSHLTLAVLQERMDIVEFLVNKGADVKKPDGYGETAIFRAVDQNGGAAMVRFLASQGANLNVSVAGRSLIHAAIYASPKILRTLLEFRKTININSTEESMGRSAIQRAVAFCKDEHVRILVQAGADLNVADSYGNTVLHYALDTPFCDFQIFSFILAQPDVDVDRVGSGGSPLMLACSLLHVDAVRALLDRKAKVDTPLPGVLGFTPLMASILRIHDTQTDRNSPDVNVVVRMLITHGANVQQAVRGSIFYTALSAACFAGSVVTISYLLGEGADVTLAHPSTGRLPLHFAAANGIENLETIMLTYRGDLMVADREGKTCLHWAAQFHNLQAVEFILKRLQDALIDQKDSDGWTALCWAVRPHSATLHKTKRSEEPNMIGVVRTLLAHGADPTVRCRMHTGAGANAETLSLTPLELARLCGTGDDILVMLEEKMGEFAGSASGHSDSTVAETVDSPGRWGWSAFCDTCLGRFYGYRFACQTCYDYQVCGKCFPHIGTFHTEEIQGDGKPHCFEAEGQDMYEEIPVSGGSDDKDLEEGSVETDSSEGRIVREMTEEIDLEELDDMLT